MAKDWPKYDESDLDNFMTHLQTQMEEDDLIVRVKIENSSSKDMRVIIEPWGSRDEFPSRAVYEIVTAGSPKTPVLHIDVHDKGLIVHCMQGKDGTIFNNGIATEAHC